MAATQIQQDIAKKMQAAAKNALDIRAKMQVLTAMYVTEGLATLTDEDYQAIPQLSHVSAVEMTVGKGSMDALLTALGDLTVGTNAYKLMKICAEVPY
jgi:hypothetical protein